MRIIGIDPGYAIVGCGIIDYQNLKFKPVHFAPITTPADMPFEQRLCLIYDELSLLISQYKPDVMSIEKLFFNTNHKTAIDVAQARGVILLTATKHNIPICEFTPLQVKEALTGYGRAEKKQVQLMTKNLLGLKDVPKPDDVADALALAICHARSANSRLKNIKLR